MTIRTKGFDVALADQVYLRNFFKHMDIRKQHHQDKFFAEIDRVLRQSITAAQLNVWDTYNPLDHTAKRKIKQ